VVMALVAGWIIMATLNTLNAFALASRGDTHGLLGHAWGYILIAMLNILIAASLIPFMRRTAKAKPTARELSPEAKHYLRRAWFRFLLAVRGSPRAPVTLPPLPDGCSYAIYKQKSGQLLMLCVKYPDGRLVPLGKTESWEPKDDWFERFTGAGVGGPR
jgi:hypothetical protein